LSGALSGLMLVSASGMNSTAASCSFRTSCHPGGLPDLPGDDVPKNGLINMSLKAIGLSPGAEMAGGPQMCSVRILLWTHGAAVTYDHLHRGASSIPAYYYEAGEIDGANFFQRSSTSRCRCDARDHDQRGIWPDLRLKVFDVIYALTNGGPGRMTESCHRDFTEIGSAIWRWRPRCPRCSFCFCASSALCDPAMLKTVEA
jgi:hypothetical protein